MSHKFTKSGNFEESGVRQISGTHAYDLPFIFVWITMTADSHSLTGLVPYVQVSLYFHSVRYEQYTIK